VEESSEKIMFDWIKNIFSFGSESWLSIDLAGGSVSNGQRVRVKITPKIPYTLELAKNYFKSNSFTVPGGKIQPIDAYIEGNSIWVDGQFIAADPSKPVQANAWVAVAIAGAAILAVTFSIDKIEIAVDKTTSNIGRLVILLIVLLLVWKFVIKRK